MSVEQWWNGADGGKWEHSGKNLSQRHSVNHKSHRVWPEFEPGSLRRGLTANTLSYGTANLRRGGEEHYTYWNRVRGGGQESLRAVFTCPLVQQAGNDVKTS
jgi:hypothetical protein